MGFLKRIFGKNDPPPRAGDEYETTRATALEQLAAGDARAAFGSFQPVFIFPDKLPEDRWSDAFEVLAKISESIDRGKLAVPLRAAAKNVDHPPGLYHLGFELIEQPLYGIAATVLMRANELAPQQEAIVTELSVALEHEGRNSDACRILRESPNVLRDSQICRYLLAFNTLMTTDLNGAQQALDAVGSGDEQVERIVEPFHQMLRRAEAIRAFSPLDDRDLRGWHAVVTGALLLHLSPYGMDEGMAGRYAFTTDSHSRILEGLKRLGAVLSACDVRPRRVLLLGDRDADAIALAAAKTLAIPTEAWNGDDAAGLLVAYDLAALSESMLRSMQRHRPGQLLWSHAMNWTSGFPITADATTYLYQVNHTPWQSGRMRIDPETQKMISEPAIESSAEELAQAIVTSELEADALADIDQLTRFARGMQQASSNGIAFAPFCSTGDRLRFRNDSPVKSSRFM